MLGFMLCVGSAASVRTAQAADASAETVKVSAGARVRITGVGFRHDEHIITWATSSNINGPTYPTTGGYADDGGGVVLTIAVKRFWEPTWWGVTLYGEDSKRTAVARFEVIASPPDGTLDVNPASAPRGTRVNFHGDGFSIYEGIKIWATSPSGAATPVTQGVELNDGEVFFYYDIPLASRTGTWYMTAYGIDTDRLLIVPFEVLP